MKTFLKLVLTLSLTATVMAGDDAGNGGDTHLTTYLEAQGNASVIMSHARSLDLGELGLTSMEIESMKNISFDQWASVIFQLKFEQVKEMLYEDGEEKAALNVPDGNLIKLSNAYYNKYPPSTQQSITLVIHEAGHKLGIRNHTLLDHIGWALATTFTARAQSTNPVLENMKRLPYYMRKSLDSKLKELALNIVAEGQGLELAYFLVDNCKGFLSDNHLGTMFYYMALSTLHTHEIFYPFKSREDYLNFKLTIIDRLLAAVITETNTWNSQDVFRFARYIVAKLTFINRVWNGIDSYFEIAVDALSITLLNKQLTTEEKSVKLKEQFSSTIFTGTLFY